MTKKKFCLVFDSSSNIKNGQYENVFVIPTIINIENNGVCNEYDEGVNLFPEEFQKKLMEQKNINVSTSQPNIGKTVVLLQELSEKYENVYVFPIPKTISGYYNSVKSIESDFNNVCVFDNFLIVNAAKWFAEELLSHPTLTKEEVQTILDDFYSRISFSLIVPDLKYLVKGGRISKFKGAIAGLLKFKIIVNLSRKGLVFFDKTQDINKIPEILTKSIGITINEFKINNIEKIGLVYDQENKTNKIPEMVDLIINYLNKENNINVEKDYVNCAIASHIGPNYIGVIILTKK